MDSFMADVTDIDANIGDEVIIFDNENITLEEYENIKILNKKTNKSNIFV